MGAVAARDCQFVMRYVQWFGLERYVEFYWEDEARKQVLGHFARAVQKLGVEEKIGIGSVELTFWQRITPDLPDKPFPGVERMIDSGKVVLKPIINQQTVKRVTRRTPVRSKR